MTHQPPAEPHRDRDTEPATAPADPAAPRAEREASAEREPRTEGEQRPKDGPRTERERAAVVGHVRSAPKYGAFIFAGFAIATIIAVLIGFFVPPARSALPSGIMTENDTVLVLTLTLAPFGAILGALTAYLIDRRAVRRAAKARENALREGVEREEPPLTEEARRTPPAYGRS